MKVARLHSRGELRIHNEPVPEPETNEALVRITSVGICGSDLHWFEEGEIGDAKLERALVLGHEFAGIIEGGDRHGQRVAVDPAISCGRCEHCRDGNPNLCWHIRFAGHGADDGALREFLCWPKQFLHRLPSSLSDEDGAMLEPLGVAIHAVDLAGIRTGMSVGVFGCGPIGLLILQVAKAAGATEIIATDRLPHRLQAARSYGATDTYLADRGAEAAAVLESTGGSGVKVAFEAAGEQDAVDTAVAACARGAKVILAGIPSGDSTSFSASHARRKGLTLKLVRRMKHSYGRAIRLVEAGRVDVSSLVTHRFPLEQVQTGFETARRREGLKVVVNFAAP